MHGNDTRQDTTLAEKESGSKANNLWKRTSLGGKRSGGGPKCNAKQGISEREMHESDCGSDGRIWEGLSSG